MAEALRNVKLVGESETSGGNFGRLRITGDAKFAEDVTCESFSLTGTAHLRGGLTIVKMTFTGDAQVDGSLRGGSLKGMGELRLGRDFRGNGLRLMGNLMAAGPVEAERIDVRGALSIPGIVNADVLTLRMYGPSRVKEIAGGTVSIRRSKGLMLKGLLQPGKRADLEAELIEGDNLYLEYVRADVVRGNAVSLGPGCVIGRVEYRSLLKKHAKAKAEQEIRF